MISSYKSLHCRYSALLLLSLLSGASAAVGDVVWTDDFSSGSLNTNYWSYDLGDGINGWGNQQLEVYTNSTANVNVTSGQLLITAIRGTESSSFTSGRIKTEDKFEFRYGRLEASIKVPNVADGLWPAFWTMGFNFKEVGWPAAGEVDIMELGQGQAIVDGVVNKVVVSGAHWENQGTYATYAKSLNTNQDLYLGFHNYTLDWTPTRMATFVDGQQIWEMDISESACGTECAELHQAHFILLNLAVGGYFTSVGSGGSSAATGSSSAACVGSSSSGGCGVARTDVTAPLPATMYVDYVRLVDNGWTQIVTPASPTPAPVDNIFVGREDTFPPVVGAAVAPSVAPVVITPAPVVPTTPVAVPTDAPVQFTFGSAAPVIPAEAVDMDCESGKGKGGKSGKGGSESRRTRRGRGRRLCTGKGKGGKGKGEGATVEAQAFESVSAAPSINDLYAKRPILPVLVAMGVMALGL